jgi:hypothetical protein
LLGTEAFNIAVQRMLGAKQGIDEMYQRLRRQAVDYLLKGAVEYMYIVF